MRLLTNDKLGAIRRWVGNSKDWLQGFLPSALSLPEVVAVVAMGSAVRNHGHSRSDFDLLVVYREKRPIVKAPMEVDIRFAPFDQLNSLVAHGDEIVCWAMKFGISLYDPENSWGQIVDEWNGRIPLPSATDARNRALQALERAKEMVEVGDDSAADDLLLAALTQFARERLIENRIFPASRPELPDQLRVLNSDDSLANLLECAMFEDSTAKDLLADLDCCQY